MRLAALILFFLCFAADSSYAAATRTIDADTVRTSDASKSFAVPTTAGKLLGAGDYVAEAVTGTVNGSNTSFSVTSAPVVLIGLYLDGAYLTPTTDYSISVATVTMVTAPATGQILRAVYFK